MSENSIIQQKLDDWCKEYIDIEWNGNLEFAGYSELAITDGFRMGMITVTYELTKKEVYGKIYLDDDHAKCPDIFNEAVLWHEFCHFWDSVEYIMNDDKMHCDHCWEFHRKKFKKPVMAICDSLLKIIGGVWFD